MAVEELPFHLQGNFAPKPFEHDADLLFWRELPPGSATDLSDSCFARLLLWVRHLDTLLGVMDPGLCLLA